METILLTIAVIFSIGGWALATWALIEVKATQRATHTFQYIDPPAVEGTKDEAGFETLTEKQKREMFSEDDLFGDETIHTSLN